VGGSFHPPTTTCDISATAADFVANFAGNRAGSPKKAAGALFLTLPQSLAIAESFCAARAEACVSKTIDLF
jgi:hypothetical protein